MPTNFPTSIDSYTTKTNNVDTISAASVNDLQDATVAIETLIGAGSNRVTTWTPTFVPSSGAFTSITYTSQVGYQIRICGAVFLTGTVSISAINTSGATGNVRIGGLPVAPVAAGSAISISQAQNWNTANPIAGRIFGLQVQLFTSLAFAEVPIANLSATSNLVFSAFYFSVGS